MIYLFYKHGSEEYGDKWDSLDGHLILHLEDVHGDYGDGWLYELNKKQKVPVTGYAVDEPWWEEGDGIEEFIHVDKITEDKKQMILSEIFDNFKEIRS